MHESARGCGLAGRMLTGLLRRDECAGIVRVKTTITPGNEGSFALFRSFASRVEAQFSETDGFDAAAHFDRNHDSERLITIGPLQERDSADVA